MVSVGTGAGFVFAGGLVFVVVSDFFAGAGFSDVAPGVGAAVASFVPVAPGVTVDFEAAALPVVSGQGDCGNAQHAALAGKDASINAESIKGKISRRNFAFIDRSPFPLEFMTCASSRFLSGLLASLGSGSNSKLRMTQTPRNFLAAGKPA